MTRNREKRVSNTPDIAALLAAQLADPTTSWSVGTFGAIAEFVRDPRERVVAGADGLSAVTDRGGIRITPSDGLRLFASESTTRTSWNQRVALCLPDDACHMSRRSVLTELGPDVDAIRETDADSILFDLGLDLVQVDACVRVADSGGVDKLRAVCGHPVFEPSNPAMGTILAASPHRVFISRIGRAEVFQPIPAPNGKSPEGPHTHVLPKLLRHRRTHAATEPIPPGFVPCGHFYPAHPAKDATGETRPYDARSHDAFQALMRMFGDQQSIALKQRIAAAISAGDDPAALVEPESRFARTTIRATLRQLLAAEGPSPSLLAWQAAYDRTHQEESDDDVAH
jgi:hypothetical protein